MGGRRVLKYREKLKEKGETHNCDKWCGRKWTERYKDKWGLKCDGRESRYIVIVEPNFHVRFVFLVFKSILPSKLLSRLPVRL